jgi:hypothetical protein
MIYPPSELDVRTIPSCGFELSTKGSVTNKSKGDIFGEILGSSRECPDIFFLIKSPNKADNSITLCVWFLNSK